MEQAFDKPAFEIIFAVFIIVIFLVPAVYLS